MNPGTDDHEFDELETRLRAAVSGRRVTTPDDLVRLPQEIPVGRGLRTGTGVRAAIALRKGLVAAITTAAVAAAVVAGLALVAVRNGNVGGTDAAAPATGGGWSWQRGDGSVVLGAFPVTKGYLGTCRSSSGWTTCTSPDGANWSIPADPNVASFDFDTSGWVSSIGTSLDGVYLDVVWSASGNSTIVAPTAPVATGSPAPTLTPAASTSQSGTSWALERSTDGIHWTSVRSSQLSVYEVPRVGVLGGRFVLMGWDTGGVGWILTSADGLDWTRRSQVPGLSGAIDPIGLVAIGSVSDQHAAWLSRDGSTWTAMVLPAGIVFGLGNEATGGRFQGYGIAADGKSVSLTSTDGLHWQIAQTANGGNYVSGAVADGHLFVSGTAASAGSVSSPAPSASVGDNAIWQSLDGGNSWEPLLNGYGTQMTGMVTTFGNLLVIGSPDSQMKVEWVGTPPAAP